MVGLAVLRNKAWMFVGITLVYRGDTMSDQHIKNLTYLTICRIGISFLTQPVCLQTATCESDSETKS